MILFFSTLILWCFVLIFLRPYPSDLHAKTPTIWESFKEIQATFWLGILLSLIFLLSSDGSFKQINEIWWRVFGVNNSNFETPFWIVQAFTHNFIHLNLIHLLSNLTLLGMMSLYERKVKIKRFLTIFLLSGIFSSISVWFISEPAISAGASAGLFGLAAAFILDQEKMTLKEYAMAISFIFFLYFMLSFQSNQNQSNSFKTDELGHILGLTFGILYCIIFPKENYNEENRSRVTKLQAKAIDIMND